MKFMKSAFLYGFPFGTGMGVYYSLQYNLFYGVYAGIISGVLFGIIIALFNGKMKKRIQDLKETANNEIDNNDIRFSSCVNLVDGFLLKLGLLILT